MKHYEDVLIEEVINIPSEQPTKELTGAFVDRCTRAKDGEQKAIAELFDIWYPQVYERLFFIDDPVARERATTEFLDRYLIGWIARGSRGPNRGRHIPPLIQQCRYNFQRHFASCLNFYACGMRTDLPMEHLNLDDVDETLHDFVDTGDFPGTLPRPHEEYELTELLERFREYLCKEYEPDSRIVFVFDMMVDEEPQIKMAWVFGVSTATIERDVATIRKMMREFMQ